MLSRDRLPSEKQEAIEFYARFLGAAARRGPEHLRLAKRWLCRNDLFYLLVVACKRPDMNHPWIFARCREIQNNPNGFLDLWAREHYKAVDVDEVVPTPSGWARHGSLKPGDWVFGPDGAPTRVVARTPVFTDAECFRVVFDDGYDVVVSGEHLWTVEALSRKRKPGGGRVGRETLTLDTRALLAGGANAGDGRFAVPIAEPIDMPRAILPIPPYTLGAWLGDGEAASGRITCGDPEVFHAIEAERRTLSHDHRRDGSAETRTVYGLGAMLRGLGLLNNKAAPIPMDYLRGSIAQRLELLRGLMDTDGHVSTRGTATFTNKTQAVAHLVFDLATGLGMKPVCRSYDADHGRFYQVSFQTRADMPPFRIARKVARCKAIDKSRRRFIRSIERCETRPVSCIQVERSDGLYLIGRQMVTTHNSTVITFGLSIQDILASHGDNPEPRYGGREVTIGILSFNNDTAADFLKQIKTELETNEELKTLFPDVLWAEPKKNAKNWSVQGGITVKRKSNPKEATVEASGLVDGQPTGKHYFIRIYDDVVVPESVSTPEQILKTTTAWELSDNLGTEGGWERYIGTRYHLFDTYRVMAERGIPTRVYPCTSDGSEDFSKAVLKSPETLADKRRKQGPYTFGAQMLLNPTADRSQGFDVSWLRYWKATSTANLNIYIIVDPASGRNRKGNDFTTMWVIGLSADGKTRVIDGVRDRLNLLGRQMVLFDLVKKWSPIGVFYEEVGIQADREHFEYVMEKENFEFTIHPIKSQVKKEERIKRLIPVFEAGRILLPEFGLQRINAEGMSYDVIRVFVSEEYSAFPVCSHDDALDCLAWIEDPAFKNLAKVPLENPVEEKPKWLMDMEDEQEIYLSGGFMAR